MASSTNLAASRAIARIDALPVTRLSATNPEARSTALDAVMAHCVYDWAAVDGKLFPDGNPLNLDLKDPLHRTMWSNLRTKQRATVAVYFDAWDGKSDLQFEQDGLSALIPASEMRVIDPTKADPRAALKILIEELGEHFTESSQHPGRFSFVQTAPTPPVDYRTGKGLFEAILQDKIRTVRGQLGNYIPGRFYIDELDSIVIRRAAEAVVGVRWSRWVKERRNDYLNQAEQYRLREVLDARSVPKPKLEDFLSQRMAKARLHFDTSTAREQFTNLPMSGARAASAKTNRTWGIELEIIDAGAIAFDAAGGWKRERDGSLRQQIGDGRTYDPWEFVSPILDMTFSKGLWMICDQAQHTVKYHKAGVHVHVAATTRRRKVFDPVTRRAKYVGGNRMTTAQVSRLIELYATVSPMLDPIIARSKTREFCTPTRVDQWAAGWFEQPTSKKPHRVRPLRRREEDAIRNAKLWAQITKGPNHDAEPTEWKRHQELNLQALNKYGTIEFRSMGAVYDYEYLTRWAWLCRTMVDYAQSDAPMAAIYKITDFTSLVRLLNQYAGEPLNLRGVKAA